MVQAAGACCCCCWSVDSCSIGHRTNRIEDTLSSLVPSSSNHVCWEGLTVSCASEGVVSLSDCCRQDKPQPQPRAEFKSWPRVASTRFPHESLPRTQSAPFLLPLYSLLLIRRSICSVPVGTQPHGATWDVARELGRRTCRQLPRFGLATSLNAPSNPCHPPPPPPITKHRPLSS